jgi:hypothetical protein
MTPAQQADHILGQIYILKSTPIGMGNYQQKIELVELILESLTKALKDLAQEKTNG